MKKCIYADAVCDLFHVGHINMFKQARAFGNYLIIGIHSDKSVERYKRTPIIPEQQRYEIVRNCKLVDEVVEDAPLLRYMSKAETEEFISKYKIDVVVHGDDTKPIPCPHVVNMGIVEYIEYTEGVSTSKILEQLREN
jgi:cytidyltransferase-like protein